MHKSSAVLAVLSVLLILASASLLIAGQVSVRHREGLIHGFLKLSTLDGHHLADGDLIQTASGNRVTSRLVFRFADGSSHDETAVFSQAGTIQLISDHLMQKGPSFPHPLEMSIDVAKGTATVRYQDDGKEKSDVEHLEMPSTVANGIVLILLKNVTTQTAPKTLSYVAATPTPRVVKLAIHDGGQDAFATGETRRQAMHYVLKAEIGGIAGLIAPLIGKEPPDTHVWVLGGPAPAFVKAEQSLYVGGPVWRIELVSPTWRE